MLFTQSEIAIAANYLKNGEVIAFPTETVYGLGASVFQEEAIRKIYQVKGRPADNPLIVHIADLDQLPLVAAQMPPEFFLLVEAFFPGPLTVLLPKKETIPSIVSAGLPTIGVRMPDHPIARALIRAVGEPLVAPSANLSGRPSSTCAAHVLEDFGSSIGGVLEGGACEIGIESTILSLSPFPQILRPGGIAKRALERVLKRPVKDFEGKMEKPLCPGMKYRHYAPKAPVRIFHSLADFERALLSGSGKKRLVLKAPSTKNLYAFLRQADQEEVEEIFIFCDAATLADPGLMNRLWHASR